MRERATCENDLGEARTLRTHWRAGAAKTRAEIMVKGLQKKKEVVLVRESKNRGEMEEREELEIGSGRERKARVFGRHTAQSGGGSPLGSAARSDRLAVFRPFFRVPEHLSAPGYTATSGHLLRSGLTSGHIPRDSYYPLLERLDTASSPHIPCW